MSAIVVSDHFDFTAFAGHLTARLPVYAHPLFLRISASLDATETFKQRKHLLAREGFDPALITDPLYFRDPVSGAYRPFGTDDHARIVSGATRI
jgi:fatty-acyl-CoA synthase